MELDLLHLDDALLAQPQFLAACRSRGGREHDLRDVGARVRLWSDEVGLDQLRAALDTLPVRGLPVTWMGSGDFHHVTALLLERIAATTGPLSVVHFDNHPDWVRHEPGLHCGSWVRSVLDRGIARTVVTIGASSRDLVWPDMKGAGLSHVASGRHVLFPLRPLRVSPVSRRHRTGVNRIAAISGQVGCIRSAPGPDALRVLDTIPEGPVYVTIDKDVLCAVSQATNWDQGAMTPEDLFGWLRLILAHHPLAGLDVTGDYSRSRHRGPWRARLLKRAEALVDQPLRVARGTDGEAINLALLDVLEDAGC